jgi:hypothetical protein
MMSSKKLTSFFNFSDADDDEPTIALEEKPIQESQVFVMPGSSGGERSTWHGVACFCGSLINESECDTLIKPGYTYYTRSDCKCDPSIPYCSIRCTWQQCKMCLSDLCRYCFTLSKNNYCDACVAKRTPNLIVLSDSDGAVVTRDDDAVVIRRDVSSPLRLSSAEEEEEEEEDDDDSHTLGSRDTDDEEAMIDESSVTDLGSSEGCEDDIQECEKEGCQSLKRKIDRVTLENHLLKNQLHASGSDMKKRKHCFYVKMIY